MTSNICKNADTALCLWMTLNKYIGKLQNLQSKCVHPTFCVSVCVCLSARFSLNWYIIGQSLEINIRLLLLILCLQVAVAQETSHLPHEEVQLHDLLFIVWELKEHVLKPSWTESLPCLKDLYLLQFFARMFFLLNSTTLTFLELKEAVTLLKSSKSKTAPAGRFFISFSTPWWKLSALIKVCPDPPTLMPPIYQSDQGCKETQVLILCCTVVPPVSYMLDVLLLLKCTDIGRCHLLCLSPSNSLLPHYWNALLLWLLFSSSKGLKESRDLFSEEYCLHPRHTGQHNNLLEIYTADREVIMQFFFCI